MAENITMKKVLHIYSSWTAGGAEKIMLSLAAALQRAGIENIIASPGDSYMFEQARKLGLAAWPLVIRGSFDPIGVFRLWRIVRRERVDIIHAHQGKMFWPSIIMKLLSGGRIKVVFHRHAQLPHRWYSRGHYRIADRVIAISKAVADGLRDREKVPEGKIRVVYNGTDFERFNPDVSPDAVRGRYNLGGRVVIGTVAAMNYPRGKGQEYLIEAAQIVKKRFPDVRYLIVGEGEIRASLEALARKLRVEDKVIFTGYCEDVENYIAAMDLFCFLSWDTEGFGQVMVEAQAMGKPVVGTNIGGIPETFRDGATGILIPARNSEYLAQVIVTLLDDIPLRSGMAAAAVPYVREHFSIGQMVEGVRAVYRELEE